MMAMANEKVTDFVVSNGARLYYEKQGTGQSLLFIAGSTGDAGNFTRAAALLADDFTVVTYDRRGNSRSERPKGWTTTSVAEQADDAAGMIQKLGLAPAVVFGASAGGPIALDLMTRHSRLVRAGILQDPAIFSVLPDPAAALAPRRALIENALKTKGPRGTIEALMCYLNDADVLTTIPADILERMLNNADTILNIEGPGFAGWQPSPDLAALGIPVVLMVARDTLPVYRQIGWRTSSRSSRSRCPGPTPSITIARKISLTLCARYCVASRTREVDRATGQHGCSLDGHQMSTAVILPERGADDVVS
jgi:pimeloyl-ACP methyl ester carboxylesterase